MGKYYHADYNSYPKRLRCVVQKVLQQSIIRFYLIYLPRTASNQTLIFNFNNFYRWDSASILHRNGHYAVSKSSFCAYTQKWEYSEDCGLKSVQKISPTETNGSGTFAFAPLMRCHGPKGNLLYVL